MERIRIAIVSDILCSEKSGMTTAALNLISYLKARGHEVRVVCPDGDPEGADGYTRILPPVGEKTGLIRKLFKKEDNSITPEETIRMTNVLRGVNIVHILTPFRLGTLALDTACQLNIPVTAGFHFQLEELQTRESADPNCFEKDTDLKVLYERFYSRVQLIHYPSVFMRGLLEGAVGKKPCQVIYNGVSARFVKADAIRPDEYRDRFVVLYTARFLPENAHETLIEAVRHSQYEPKIQLIFAGEGPLESSLKEAAKSLTNPPVMQSFDRSTLLNVINYADLYVHAAEVDSESVSCIEAVNCGLVPVISNSPKSAARFYAIGSKNLYQYDDPLDLASRIEYWMEHPEEKEKLSLRYQQFTRDFSLMKCMEKLELMLYKAAGKEA